jgi:hypothetical protein
MYLHLDEPTGFRHDNNERQAVLTLALIAVMATVIAVLVVWAVKFVPGAG